jgi:hypothetical protein
MSSDNATNVIIVVQRTTITCFIESGDCAIAYSSVVGVLDNISHASIHVADVVMTSRIINGTAPILRCVFAALTMTTHIVYAAMYTAAYAKTGVNITITVVNATLDVIHATTLPPGPLFMLVLSTASIVNVVRALTNCSISVTADVNLCDVTGAVVSTNEQLSQFAWLIYPSTGGVCCDCAHQRDHEHHQEWNCVLQLSS